MHFALVSYTVYRITFFLVNRVEHQKLKQTTPYTVYSVRWGTFFPVNRVEHQKLNQTTPYGAVLLRFWWSTRPSADGVD